MTGMMWLTNATIVGGSKIDLNAQTVGMTINAFIDPKPVPGKDMTGTWDSRMAKVNFTGFDNPRYTIEGKFLVTNDYTANGVNTNSAGSVLATVAILGSFITCGSPSWFYSPRHILNPIGSAAVLPSAFRIINKEDNTNEDLIEYTMELVETKEW